MKIRLLITICVLLLLISLIIISNNKNLYVYLLLYISSGILILLLIKNLLKNNEENDFSNYQDLDELYDENGKFEFYENGFYIKNEEEEPKFINWDDIIEINKVSIPVLKHHQISLEIITNSEKIEIYENEKGWYKLTFEINQNINGIDKSWTLDKTFDYQNATFNYGVGRKNIFKRS